MQQALLRVYNWSWYLIITSLVAFFLVMAGMRVIVTWLPFLQEPITHYLGKQMHVSLAIGKLSSDWNGGMPRIKIKDLQLQSSGKDTPDIKIHQLDLELNIRDSLLHRMWIFNNLTAEGVAIRAYKMSDGDWKFAGIKAFNAHRDKKRFGRLTLLKWLQHQGVINISSSSLTMILNKNKYEQDTLKIPYLLLQSNNGKKNLNAKLEWGKGVTFIKGSSFHHNYERWHGSVLMDNMDFSTIHALFPIGSTPLTTAILSGGLAWYSSNQTWQVTGGIKAQKVHYISKSGHQHKVSTGIKVLGEGTIGKDWSLWLQNLVVKLDGENFSSGNWYIKGRQLPEDTITIANQQIQLAPLKAALLRSELLPSLPTQLLQTLNPTGAVNNFALRLYTSRKPFDIDLSAQFDRVSVDAWHNAPSAGNISGALRMNLLKGYLDLDAKQFSLGFPKLFPQTWHYKSVHAGLYWDVIKGIYTLKSDHVELRSNEEQVTSQFALNIPLDKKPASMALIVDLDKRKVGDVKKYIPERLSGFSNSLTNWLKAAIQGGTMNKGLFFYNGLLGAQATPVNSSWGLYFNLSDALLDYNKDWPAISKLDGQVFVDNKSVNIQGKQAETLGAKLDHIVANIPLKENSSVSVKGQIAAKNNTLYRFLSETPINDFIGGLVKNWRLQGDFSSQLQLTIPLDHPKDTNVDLKGKVNNYSVALPEYKIAINRINGDIEYSTAGGLKSKTLQGVLFGQPIKASIATNNSHNMPVITHINWQGIANINDLNKIRAIDLPSWLQGQANYSGKLSLNNKNKKMNLNIHSDLQGIFVNLPMPLHKEKEAKLPLDINYTTHETGNHVNIMLHGLAKAALRLKGDNSMEGASILLGKNIQRNIALPVDHSQHIKVQGTLPELDITPWLSQFNKLSASKKGYPLINKIIIDNVSIEKLRYDHHIFNNVKADLHPDGDAIKISLSSDVIEGSLWVPKNGPRPYRLRVNYLRLPSSMITSKRDPHEKNTEVIIDPSSIPATDVSIGSLTIGKAIVRNISFNIRKIGEGVKADSLHADLFGLTLGGKMKWIESKGQQSTELYGELSGSMLDELYKAFNFSSFITAKHISLLGRLRWAGAPMDVSFANIAGTLNVNMEDGRLQKIDKGTDALKLFGLLNIESLRRRLKLDFSDIYASGVSFDTLSGTFRFDKGMVTFDSPIIIKGPSSNFKLNGLLNTVNNTMDMSVVVTLPVSANLPFISVLFGATPQIAGMIYLADKLVGRKVDLLSSVRYQVKGSFDDPKVSLDKLFSNTAKKPDREK